MITDRTNPFVCGQGKVFCAGNTDSEKAGVGKRASGMIKGVGNTDILFYVGGGYIKWMICKVRPLAGRK